MDLAVLRTAKAALDEGLIETEDFQTVKASFVRAQSIKAGLDAGFITDSDFAEARQQFFVNMAMGVAPASPAVRTFDPPIAAAPREARLQSQPSAATARPTEPEETSESASDKQVPAAIPSLSLDVAPTNTAAPELDSARAASSSSMPTTPSSIPDHGGAQKTSGKASMSGIKVHPDSINIVGELRIRKKYRWIIFKIGQEGKQVEIDQCGGPKSTFSEFASYMPESECRYGVYDYEYRNSEGTTYGKLVFISWAPEVAPTKAKMQHASTKDFFRGFLDGISVEMHATEASELDDSAMRDRVANTVAKK